MPPGTLNQESRCGGSVWESNVIPNGISSTYEEHGGAKKPHKGQQGTVLFPDLFPRFSPVAKDPDGGEFAHTLTMHTSTEKKNQAVRMAQPITHTITLALSRSYHTSLTQTDPPPFF